jgi:ATP-binding cassette subfamily F protein uup
MDRLVDHLFVFEGEGVVRDFPGNYSIYRMGLKEDEQKKKAAEHIAGSPENANISTQVSTKEKKRFSFNEKREFEQLGKDIPALEKEKADVTEKMSAPGLPYEDLQKLSARITEITSLLEEKEMRWLELSEYAS